MYESKSYSPVPASYASYSNQLQFAPHEEGRISAIRTAANSNPGSFAYDYMLKDHLGNVRMVLTEQTRYSRCSLFAICNGEAALRDL